ncbi:restriction endonuclease subunit S [Tepidanaerobacter sp. GT38]|uniref:restriction endonuclease subunit S n=1 Tax=Tepidanaerobacter sp. GT38 TaxID=2722793 RepID=UPI001F2A19FB|nr:restriction endonuclease subunit S [Tepidanaerobacter sp. GT38]MCG1012235.1 restriction endonuclease subunit S [Tepidanaerobacter sp. GT38]
MSKYKRYERYKDSGVEWLGEIPEHWEIGRLKNSIKSCRNGIWGDEPQGDNNDVACIRVTDFNRINMEIEVNDITIRNIPASKQKMYLLKYGDLLIEKSGGGEKQPVGFVTIFKHNIPAVYANFIARMELKEEKAYSGFYKYVHSAMYSVRLNVRSIKQTTGIQNLDTNYYFEERVIYPPLNEQKAIANFLDQKTAEIDALIADKEKLIELLQEKRQAIITEAVTKGLNPNVRMKDSGIEWIGEIPEHWILSKIKYVSLINNKTLSESTDDDYEIDYIDISSVTSIGEIDGIQRLNFKDAPSRARRILSKGDTIVSTVRTYLKAIAFIENVQSNLICSTGFAVLTPLSKVVPKYLFYLMRSEKYVNEIVRRSVGVSYPAINASDIGALECAIPNKDEQKYIVEYLDNCTTQIDQLVNDIQTQIQKLKEYRQSLISEAVTGKIDVREFQKKNEVIFRNE